MNNTAERAVAGQRSHPLPPDGHKTNALLRDRMLPGRVCQQDLPGELVWPVALPKESCLDDISADQEEENQRTDTWVALHPSRKHLFRLRRCERSRGVNKNQRGAQRQPPDYQSPPGQSYTILLLSSE
ncbi:unnamed protein product [Pleuronectes platessa]|uniref:Uncharacterized protein n=1 Tax=Pleuronectes platessa TaxID=8262 RepID=A0A9N7Z736_PLEPL|nr:unnamed protein product [Pleuronectes platessa]